MGVMRGGVDKRLKVSVMEHRHGRLGRPLVRDGEAARTTSASASAAFETAAPNVADGTCFPSWLQYANCCGR